MGGWALPTPPASHTVSVIQLQCIGACPPPRTAAENRAFVRNIVFIKPDLALEIATLIVDTNYKDSPIFIRKGPGTVEEGDGVWRITFENGMEPSADLPTPYTLHVSIGKLDGAYADDY